MYTWVPAARGEGGATYVPHLDFWKYTKTEKKKEMYQRLGAVSQMETLKLRGNRIALR